MLTPPGPLRLAVVIVTYNSSQVLPDCLASLADGCEGTDLRAVLVADNDSADGCSKLVDDFPELPARSIQVGWNAGYAAAINVAVATLDTDDLDAIFVMNPDCRMRPKSMAILGEALRAHGDGIAVPKIVNPDDTLQPSLRRYPTLLRAAVEAMVGGRLAGRVGALGELITKPEVYEQARPAAWATGAALLVSQAAATAIGPWEESFLLYSEETDYQLRAGDLGFTIWYEPESVVEHIGGEAGVNPMLASLLTVNRVRLYRRRHGKLAALLYYLVVTVGEGIRAAAGRSISKAAFVALVRPSRRVTALPAREH